MSTGWPRSSASSCVSSIGKPYVVASLKASSPEIASLPASSSNTFSPRASVSRKRSSSSAHDPLDLGGVLDELRIGVAHLLDHDAGSAVDAVEPDALACTDGAADDAAQDVAAALVRRRDAVGDQERHRAAVVGEHAVRLRRARCRRSATPDSRLDPVHDQAEAVGVEVRRDVLEEHRAALEAEPGVDVLRRAAGTSSLPRPQVELHEDEVAELHVAVAARSRAGSPRSPQPCSAPRS